MSVIRLHGREGELEAIAGALAAVAGGERRVIVLRGEAGIGKTRLLETVRDDAARRHFVVLEGRATELESDLPLVPVIEAVAPRLHDLPPGALRELGEERAARLAQVLSEDPGAAGPDAEHAAERWRLHRAIADLLPVLGAGRPTALLLDDIHWADPATLELLEHLVRRPPRGAHLLVIATRPGDAAERVLAARRATPAPSFLALDLAPLARPAADALLVDVPDPARRERLYRESGGNPLLLQELSRPGGAEAVPGGIVAAVRTEIVGLTGDSRALVEAAAIAGDPFDVDIAGAMAGLDETARLLALDGLTERAIVRATATPRAFTFRHPVIRSAVYASLSPGARLAGHRAAAGEFDTAGAAAPIVARHLAHAATPGDTVASATLRTAAALVRPQAPSTAADWLLAAERASPDEDGRHLAALAGALVESGRLGEALDVVDAAATARAGGDDVVRLAVAGAAVERLLGRHAAARRRLERALDATAPGGPSAARLMADLALSAYQRGEQREMLEWARRAREIPDAGNIVTAATAAMLATGHAYVGEMDAAWDEVAVVLAAVGDATDAELGPAAELLTSVPWGLIALERLEDGLATARRVGDAARRAGNGVGAVAMDIAAVLALGLLGRIDEAAALADQTEQAARVTGNDQAVQWALWMRAWVLIDHGELDTALAAAQESVALGERLDDSALATIGRTVLGAALAAGGDHARGRDLLARYDIDPGWICRWAPPLVEADLALGDHDAARAHAARAAENARRVGLAGARATAGRAEALVAVATGDPERATALALAAAEAAREAGCALDEARARLVAGRGLGATDRAVAFAELQAAERGAIACGAPRLRDEVHREMRSQGHRVGRGGPRAPGAEGLDALSPREREIAEQVATGRTNRQIGEALYLSEKTVETHLSRVFVKLGVRSRAEVAARVAAGTAAGAEPR